MTGALVLAIALSTNPAEWTAAPSDGVSAVVSRQGEALRVDLDFHGGGGYAVVRRALDLDLPPNYAFTFRVRGDLPPNTLEFKLLDPTGDNVWWHPIRDFAFSPDGRTVRIKKRHVVYAWGPSKAPLARAATLEIAITAGKGGTGHVLLDRFTYEELPPEGPYTGTPWLTAPVTDPEHPPSLALDGHPDTYWSSGPVPTENPPDTVPPCTPPGGACFWVDFGVPREFGGLVLDWHEDAVARDYRVETSLDGRTWDERVRIVNTNGGRDWIPLPETEARHLRLVLLQPWSGKPFSISEIAVQPLEWAADPNAFLMSLAREARRGLYPRGFVKELAYWTVVGQDGGREEALLNEDGAVEAGHGAFSIEPFLGFDDRFWTWADVTTSQRLEGGDLPIPTTTWEAGDLRLAITALVDGPADDPRLLVRYRLTGPGRPRRALLRLAVRPFQVNPPSQFLNGPGGFTAIRTLVQDGTRLVVEGQRVVHVTRGEWKGTSFAYAAPHESVQGHFCPNWLFDRRADDAGEQIRDPLGLASAISTVDGEVGGEATLEVVLEATLRPGDPSRAPLPGTFDERLAAAKAAWKEKLAGVDLRLPPQARDLASTIRSQLAYILINRDGPAIQPGSRAYARSWIRDGALTSAALLRLGRTDAARDFVTWFAPFQYPDGKVPCCVDHRGADPVPENDSHGELLFAIADMARFTGDRAWVETLWPHIEGAVSYLDLLRQKRRTEEYRAPDKRAFFGLLPESISHEGYSDKPVHSYWDDLWALRGLKDAVRLAELAGKAEQAARWSAIRDQFQADLVASMEATREQHGIDYQPASVEYGDRDPTSSTITFDPVGADAVLPAAPLQRTFELYWTDFVARRDGARPWDVYTPYEWRNVGAMIRLGWKDRAHEAIAWFLGHRRPAGWNHWAEVVLSDPRRPQFIGDMPHTWCGSDFIRSVLDLFWYERERDGSLVLGAGIPESWARAEGGVAIGLPTPHGSLSYSLSARGSTAVFEIRGLTDIPPGGLVLATPLAGPVESVTVNGAKVEFTDQVRVRTVPATVEIRHRR